MDFFFFRAICITIFLLDLTFFVKAINYTILYFKYNFTLVYSFVS